MPSTTSATGAGVDDLECPGCGKGLLARRRGEWTIANRIVVLREDGVYVVCPTCPEQIRVPFLISVQPSGPKPQVPGRRIVVRVGRD